MCKLLNRMMLKYYIFSPFSTDLRKQQKILACLPEHKLSTLIFEFKNFHPRVLTHRVLSVTSVEYVNIFSARDFQTLHATVSNVATTFLQALIRVLVDW